MVFTTISAFLICVICLICVFYNLPLKFLALISKSGWLSRVEVIKSDLPIRAASINKVDKSRKAAILPEKISIIKWWSKSSPIRKDQFLALFLHKITVRWRLSKLIKNAASRLRDLLYNYMNHATSISQGFYQLTAIIETPSSAKNYYEVEHYL